MVVVLLVDEVVVIGGGCMFDEVLLELVVAICHRPDEVDAIGGGSLLDILVVLTMVVVLTVLDGMAFFCVVLFEGWCLFLDAAVCSFMVCGIFFLGVDWDLSGSNGVGMLCGVVGVSFPSMVVGKNKRRGKRSNKGVGCSL